MSIVFLEATEPAGETGGPPAVDEELALHSAELYTIPLYESDGKRYIVPAVSLMIRDISSGCTLASCAAISLLLRVA